ncbi:testis-expressed protein 48 [Nycticebus coucang]|uniref:testis-expressed protein 48 n=1 Tax=Nycticebus coucang TaxID=9470 RepID=UPI00234D7343|nr:testis-expressed protein 48 [Nycticebus coucang]
MVPIPLPPTPAHQSLASKIFCLCCRDCQESSVIDTCKVPNQTQEQQPSTHGGGRLNNKDLLPMGTAHLSSPVDPVEFSLPGTQHQKGQLDRLNPKNTKGTSHLPSGQSLIHPEKTASFNSSDFEGKSQIEVLRLTRNPWRRGLYLYTKASQSNFYKRNLNRYSQERWPFQTCFIGRP